jgi:hypothetical protein
MPGDADFHPKSQRLGFDYEEKLDNGTQLERGCLKDSFPGAQAI